MFGDGLGKDHDIIQIYKLKLTNNSGQYHVDSPLKGACGILKSKWHPFELVAALMGSESRFFFVDVVKLDFPLSGVGVQREEFFGLSETFNSFIHSGDLVYFSYV